MIKSIKSYIPESNFFESKNRVGCRIIHDDCAIVHAREPFPILAERGFGAPLGTSLLDACALAPNAKNQLKELISSDDECLLLPCKKNTLLVFSPLLESTELLIVIRVSRPEDEVQKSLEFARRHAFSPIFCPESEHRSREAMLAEQLSEIFYYIDRITTPSQEIGPWTRILLTAGFVGCQLDYASLPVNETNLTKRDRDRMAAFFLCAFLILRHHTGTNETVAYEPLFSVCLKHRPTMTDRGMLPKDEYELMDPTASPFSHLLALPCFQGIQCAIRNNALVFELPLRSPTAAGSVQTSAISTSNAISFEIRFEC